MKTANFPNFCVPDKRDLHFASTGSNFGTLVKLQRYTRNTTCISACTVSLADRTGVVNPPADRLPPLRVRDFRLDLEQISADFEIEHFETASKF